MKTRIIIFIVAFLSGSHVFAQQSGEIPIPLSDAAKRGKLIVDIKNGSITVKGSSRKDVLVKYSSTETDNHHHKKESKNGLKKIGGGTMDLEVSENNNTIKVSSDAWNNGVNLVIEIPADFDLKVDTYNNGDIHINNINGEVVAVNYNGEITAEAISGSVVGTTYNGAIKVTFNKVKPDTPMAFSTYNGDVDLTFPSSIKYSFKMKTAQGEIYSDFDMSIQKSEPVKKEDKKYGTYKVYLDEWVKGNVNGGGPEIMIKNYNGDIIIRKG